jgi:DNA-binding transcriptional ArsR family regulator
MSTSSFSPGRRTKALNAPPAAEGHDLQAQATEAAALLKALANPARLLLLCQLIERERTVTELGVLAGIEQPSLSQQLGILRGERLVTTRREGKSVFYRIASPAALTVLGTLNELFCSQPPATPAAQPVRRRKAAP